MVDPKTASNEPIKAPNCGGPGICREKMGANGRCIHHHEGNCMHNDEEHEHGESVTR